jgi:hypothetical protein
VAAVASPAAEIPFGPEASTMRGSLGIERRHNQRDSIHEININFSNAPSRSKNASTDQTTAAQIASIGSVLEVAAIGCRQCGF